MLQWMGGSRRKVNDSRRSKQKRQKQYFEQRKRQQHEQTTSSPDNLVDDYNNTCSKNLKEKRSLDVLSMHSLLNIADGCIEGIMKDDSLPEKFVHTRNSPNFTVTAANNFETLQAGRMSNTPEKRMIEKERRVGISNLYSSTSTEGNTKGGEVKHSSSHTTSVKEFKDLNVFELVDEDGNVSHKSEEKTAYEAHVAFSMQGLGKVGHETPVKSPQSSRRILSDGQACSFKAARHQHLHKNIDNLQADHEIDMESMIDNDDMFSNDKYLTSAYSQSWRVGSYDYPKHDFSKDDSIELYDENPQVNSFDGKENIDDIQELHTHFLEVNTGAPCGSSYNKNIDMSWEKVNTGFPIGTSCNKKIDMSWEKRCFTDVSNISRTREADFAEDYRFSRRSSYSDQYGQTDRFGDLDFLNRYSNHQLLEDCDVFKSDDSNYFPGNKFLDAGAKQSHFSFLKADNPMDNFSSLSSGESCSSSAVKGDSITGAPTSRKSRKRCSFFAGSSPKNPSIMQDFPGQPAMSTQFIPQHHGEYESPRAFSRPVDLSEFAFGESFDQFNDSTSKDVFRSKSTHMARRMKYDSSHHRSNKDHSSDCKPVGEGRHGLFSSSSFHFDSPLSFGGCKDDSSVESACPTGLPPKKSAFVQDFASFPDIGCWKSRKDSNVGFDTLPKSTDSTEVSGNQEHKDVLTEQCSAHNRSHDKNTKDKVSHGEDICAGHEGTVSVTPKRFRKTQDKFSKKNTDGNIGSNIFKENDNDTSSFVALSDNSDSRASERCQTNNVDVQLQQPGPEKSNSEHNSIASDGEDSCIEPSYQLMMLESHMLQLLCVKKKRKSAQKVVVKTFEESI